jgi:hypothetical protein
MRQIVLISGIASYISVVFSFNLYNSMKRYLALFAAVLAISLSSCKKDYNCQCIGYSGTKDLINIHDTKSKAKKECESWSVGIKGKPGNMVCTLK